MSGRLVRRVAALAIAALFLLIVAFLPATVPTADNSGAILPGLATPIPVATGAVDSPIRPVGPLNNGAIIAQQFPANGTRIDSVAVFLGTYLRVNHGALEVGVDARTNGAWKNLATRSVNKETLADNAFYSIALSPPLEVAKGQTVRITLSSDDGRSDAVTWWMNANWRPDGYALFYNGERQEGTARFTVTYSPRSGRLFQVFGPIWGRLTVFLTPLWRGVLLLGLVLLGGSIIAMSRRLLA
jgi:hypothetical protein